MMIYSIAFAAAISSLAAWFLHRSNDSKSNLFQTTFFASLGIFAITVMFADVDFEQKLKILFRDLSVMSGFGLFFQVLSMKKRWFMMGGILAALSFIVYQRTIMAYSFRMPAEDHILYDASGELLMELAENADIDAVATVQHKYSLQFTPAFQPADPASTELDDYYVVDVPEEHEAEIQDIINDLQSVAAVDWVEPNETVTVSPLEGRKPSAVNKKFGINDPGLGELWGFESMGVDKLYDYLNQRSLKPQKKALIAILDTGVDAKHEDIKGNYVSIEAKSDNDPRGHGTHCAGIAGAVSNNGVGVASFSRGNEFVQVSSIKVLSSSGMGTQKMIIDGIIKASDAGADVISMSLGGLSNQTKERAYQKAVAYANNKGAVVVAAAGNSNRNAKNYAPAGVPGVITVSAIDERHNRAVFSNYVTDVQMGIAAPGVNIYSTIPNSQYATYSGTSMATPYVSGLVGLLKSLDPALDTQTIHQLLSQTGAETRNTLQTGYLIQPYQAVRQLIESRAL